MNEIENSEATQIQPTPELPVRRRPLLAQIISDIFSPITVPTYGMILAMWATPLRSIPESNRLIATLLVAVITGLLPLIAITLLIKTGKVNNRSVSDRRQRPLPMSIAAICYMAAGMFVGSLGAPMWLRMFFIGASIATFTGMLITLKWKISAHTTAMGGLTGMILWFAISGMADVNIMILFSIGIILSGAIATSRLLLQRHDICQVLAGLALGFVFCFGAMWIR